MENKLSKVFYQPQNLWVASKAIRELHKTTGISRADIKSLLARQALWQVYSSHPKKINQPHYEVTKLSEQHQFDLLYMPGNTIEGNKYNYIIMGLDVASRYKVARPLTTKKASNVAFVLEAVYKKEVRSNT